MAKIAKSLLQNWIVKGIAELCARGGWPGATSRHIREKSVTKVQ